FAVIAKLLLEPRPGPGSEQGRLTSAPRGEEARKSVPAPPVAGSPSALREQSPSPKPEVQRLDRVDAQPQGAACVTAADCRGPKLADCIVATCQAGRCAFDRSSCECTGDDECDDGVQCTRDLCFAATKKCIHIRSECN
ncbi:MAG TPA: hypothetical protein VFU02_07955, partial [Polyangiaceae bacterium]|nr:hypothetical protein [Polyangiaceae bacterium]